MTPCGVDEAFTSGRLEPMGSHPKSLAKKPTWGRVPGSNPGGPAIFFVLESVLNPFLGVGYLEEPNLNKNGVGESAIWR